MTSTPVPEARSSYDEVPYLKSAFPQTHPDRLATLARLFGLAPPDLETCRVLELGCASGDNLIPMALGLPNARFLGIDSSIRQIQHGRQTIDALGLTNIELRHASIADMTAADGRFDYIVCHGVYSWVPEPIREAILQICRDNLVSEGVAYVSYNTLPGWRVRGMIRDMMIYHSDQFEGAAERLQQARALLDFLAQSVPADLPHSTTLKQELNVIRPEADAYLFHDYLEDVNEPVYFHQFAKAAARNRLQYLAEADFSGMLVSNFPPQVAETLRRIATDIVRMEQYMDFVRNRTFRQTLLVHEGAPIKRNLDGQALAGFLLVSSTQPASAQPSLAQGVPETFRIARASVTTPNGITKAALLFLTQQYPLGIGFEELASVARARLVECGVGDGADATPERDRQILGNDLLQAYAVDAVELHVRIPRMSSTPSARPVASPLARLQATQGEKVTNLRHEVVVLDSFSRQILPLLDGTRDREALAAALAKLAKEGVLKVRDKQSGASLTSATALDDVLRRVVQAGLPSLARAALLQQ